MHNPTNIESLYSPLSPHPGTKEQGFISLTIYGKIETIEKCKRLISNEPKLQAIKS